MNYEYFSTKYGAGICKFMSEQLRMDLLDAALDMVDDVNTTLCMTHVKILTFQAGSLLAKAGR